MVSRKHALINYINGDYFLTDQSSNGTFVNDSPNRLSPGEEWRINEGDRLLMGNYLVAASLVPADASRRNGSVPRRDPPPPLSHPAGGKAVEINGGVDEGGPLPEMEGWSSDAKRPNWFPSGEDESSEVGDPFPEKRAYEERPPVPVLQQHLAPPAQARPHNAEPQEWGQTNRGRLGTGVPTGYVPGVAPLETLTGLELVPGGDTGNAPVPSRSGEPETAGQPRPGVPPNNTPTGSATTERPREADPLPVTAPSGVRASTRPATPTGGGVSPRPVSDLPPADSDLLDALLKGLGSPALPLTLETAPRFAVQIGQLVREAVQGMINTLRLRDEFKREFYVPVTRIAPTDNNVFKHSANVDDAFARAFSGPSRSAYLDPVESSRQAFHDIAAHQLALVAGMQAAVALLLERFSPQALEKRLGKATIFNEIVPQIRKAHMWEQFEKEYATIAEQAEEDFQRVFGQHFERAYSQQIDKLRSAGFGGNKEADS